MGNLGVGGKLAWCLGAMSAVAIASFVESSFAVGSIRTEVKREIAGSVLLLDQSRHVDIDVANMRGALRGVSLFGLMKNRAQVDQASAAFDATAADALKVVAEMKNGEHASEDRESMDSIQDALEQWVRSFPAMRDLTVAGQALEASQYILRNITPLMDTLQKETSQLGRVSLARQQAATQRADADIEQIEAMNFVLGPILLICALGSAWVVARLVRRLKSIVGSMHAAAEQVTGAASQVAAASNTLAQNASEQAASLEEVSASLEAVNAHVQKTTDTVHGLAGTMEAAAPLVERVDNSLRGMLESMSRLMGSSQKIAGVVKTIDEIAFQTNILALNAAVEAARSGEAGLGFAVVAEEVRNLAQRCAAAAKETGSMIEHSLSTVDESSRQLDQLLEANTENSGHAGRIREMADHVVVETGEQGLGMAQITQVIPAINASTQRVASTAQESAAAGQQLKADALGLRQIAGDLDALVGGRARPNGLRLLSRDTNPAEAA
jgi:methyl-accepting chemotaxis protein